MKHILSKFSVFCLSIVACVAYAQSSPSFSKSPLPSTTFINNLVGSYRIIKTDTNGQCPLQLGDEFIISYTTDSFYQETSVGMFVIEAASKDTLHLGKENLPFADADPRIWTGVETIAHEDAAVLKRHTTQFLPETQSWLRTIISFDVSYAPGVYLQIWQNSSVCTSFVDGMPLWDGGSSVKLPDSCAFVEDENSTVPASFYCLAQKLDLNSLHAAQ